MTTRIELQSGDLNTFHADVLVNATTSSLLGNAVVEAAGPGVLKEIQRIRESNLTDGLSAGATVATNAGNLPAKWIVHTVAPEWDADEDRSETLTSCYTESVELADKLGALSIVLPAIGLDSGWPAEDAARIAIAALQSTDTHVELVTVIINDNSALSAFESSLAAGREDPAA